MTFKYWKKPDPKIYEFTAFTADDLFGSLHPSSGQKFDMPICPTVTFNVKDDDGHLNDEKWGGTKSEDRSYQTADIAIDGGGSVSAARVFADGFVKVKDLNTGHHYKLIKISVDSRDQDGGNPDSLQTYYTFKGDVPPPGANLKVWYASGHGFDVDYKWLGAGDRWELDENCAYHIEAEDMQMHGFKKAWFKGAASGDKVVKTFKMGTLTTVFAGEDGTYDLDLTVIDENDGQGTIIIKVNGVEVETFTLDQDTGGNGTLHDFKKRGEFRDLEIDGVELTKGDKIEIIGIKDHYEFVRIDKLSLTQQKNADPDAAADTIVVVADGSGISGDPLLLNDVDTDGDPISIVSVGGVGVNTPFDVTTDTLGGTVNISVDDAGAVTLNSVSGLIGVGQGETDTASFEYTITDGNGGMDTVTVSLNVEGVNDAPTITTTQTLFEIGFDEAFNIGAEVADVDATDPDLNDTIVYTIDPLSDDAEFFEIDADGKITTNQIIPAFGDLNEDSDYEITVIAMDDFGASDTIDLTLDLVLSA